ncbi:hypothetical protein JCM10213v2_002096 [Rhodosporidiobolus nylandii]
MPASCSAAYDAPGAPASPPEREQRGPLSGAHSSSEGPEQVVEDAASDQPSPSPFPGPSDEPPSPFAVRKRSRAVASVTMTDDSDLSELSSLADSGSDGAEEDTEDGDEEEKQGDDGHKRAGGAAISSAADLPVTDLWPRAANEALVRGLELIPDIGVRTTKSIRNQQMGRNGLLSEYMCRQTGLLFSGYQLPSKLQSLRSRVGGRRSPAPLSSYRHRDWDAFLGPDLYPHTVKKPKKLKKEKKRSTSFSKPKKRKREGQLVASPLPQPPGFPSPSSSSSSVLSASDLSAFFTSICPSHTFTSSAAALHSSGIRTPGDLFRLVSLENETLAALLDGLAEEGKVSVLDKAWLRRAVEEGRRLFATGG